MIEKIYGHVQWTGNPEIDAVLAQTAWLKSARPNQILNFDKSYGYLLQMGRGTGKSQTLCCSAFQLAARYPNSRIAMVARTNADARGTLFTGASGLENNIPRSCITKFTLKPLEIHLWNGSMFQGFSAEEPRTLRGPSFSAAFLDELGFWDGLGSELEDPYEMVRFATRLPLPTKTKIVAGTTPDDIELLFKLEEDPEFTKVYGSSYENRENLDEMFIRMLSEKEGTILGEMEIHGKLTRRDSNAMFKKEWFKYWPRRKKFPPFQVIIQSWDLAFTEKKANDPTAVTTWGVFNTPQTGFGIMLLDAWEDHMGFPELCARFVSEFNRGHGPEGKLFINVMVVEMLGPGISLFQQLETLKIPVHPATMTGGASGQRDKVARASIVAHLPEKGQIWIPEGQIEGEPPTWAEDWLKQITRFSTNKKALKNQHDDYVDSTVHAWRYIIDSGYGRNPIDIFERQRIMSQRRAPFSNPYLRI